MNRATLIGVGLLGLVAGAAGVAIISANSSDVPITGRAPEVRAASGHTQAMCFLDCRQKSGVHPHGDTCPERCDSMKKVDDDCRMKCYGRPFEPGRDCMSSCGRP